MIPRLGVNIDHVATIRQQRGESYPEVFRAAELSLAAGADQITIHLREDRRHIQDSDVGAVHQICKKFQRPLNFEMGCHPEIVSLACQEKPAWVCLVPEKREERTTEGGLALTHSGTLQRVTEAIETLKLGSPNTKISLFIEASDEVIEASLKLPVQAVEIHTGDYAKEFLMGKDISKHLDQYAKACKKIKLNQRGFHAGHGLTNLSVVPLLKQGLFEEYNIGHWIIAESLFLGLPLVVSNLVKQIRSSSH
ncbi:MAG: pyridoxine 5'-phosphate synthase [Bacteriovoracaceae bacterium]|nr:pyridoxine 5'-phosphate synthase [Bacteriovoracaceae bacterium]